MQLKLVALILIYMISLNQMFVKYSADLVKSATNYTPEINQSQDELPLSFSCSEQK
jgi:hypothetical protein